MSSNTKKVPTDTSKALVNNEEVRNDTEEAPTDTEDLPTGTEDAPTGTEDAPTGTEDAPTGTEDAPTNTEEDHTDSENVSTDTKNVSTDTEDVSNDAENFPADIQDVSTEILDVSTDIQDVSTEIQDVSTDIQDVSTEILDVSTDIQDVSTDIQDISTDRENVFIDRESVSTDANEISDEDNSNDSNTMLIVQKTRIAGLDSATISCHYYRRFARPRLLEAPRRRALLGETAQFYAPTAGEILNNRYSVDFLLGKGRFSEVIQAIDIQNDNHEVAIKIIKKDSIRTGMNELNLYIILHSHYSDGRNFLRFYGNFIHMEHLCLVLEPMMMNLFNFIHINATYSGGLELSKVHSLVPQLLVALEILKRYDIVHTDIKPENILVNDRELKLKLADFGSALSDGERFKTPYLSSRSYRAPEVILGCNYGHLVDIWAAGCIIYEMITGKVMFLASSNNHMIKKFLEYDTIPEYMIRRGTYSLKHFNRQFQYKHIINEHTHQEYENVIPSISKTRNLKAELTPPVPILLKDVRAKKLTLLIALVNCMVSIDPKSRANIARLMDSGYVELCNCGCVICKSGEN